MKVLLIGNGTSRKDLDISSFVKTHNIDKTVGCNGIWRDYDTDFVVMWDNKPIYEFIVHKCEYEWYSRLVIPDSYEKNIVGNLVGRTSGSYALYWSILHFNPTDIYMIGFDYFLDYIDCGSQIYSYINEEAFVCSQVLSEIRAEYMSNYMKSKEDITFHILVPDGINLNYTLDNASNVRTITKKNKVVKTPAPLTFEGIVPITNRKVFDLYDANII